MLNYLIMIFALGLSACTDYTKPFQVKSVVVGCDNGRSPDPYKLLHAQALVECLDNSYSKVEVVPDTGVCVTYVYIHRYCADGSKEDVTNCHGYFKCSERQ